MAFCPATFPELSCHWQWPRQWLHFLASLSPSCIHVTNACQCHVSRTDVCHSQGRNFKNLVCLLHFFFFFWFLQDAEDSEALKAEPQDRRIDQRIVEILAKNMQSERGAFHSTKTVHFIRTSQSQGYKPCFFGLGVSSLLPSGRCSVGIRETW